MKSSVITHFTAVALFSLIMLLMYAAVQQSFRSVDNEPQVQLARDNAHNIKYTRTYRYYLNSAVHPKHCPGTFMQLYNAHGQLLFSGGTVHDKAHQIPNGDLDNAKQYYKNAFAWRPARNMHLATVAAYTTIPEITYVVVTRSLQEEESLETRLTPMILFPGLFE